MTRIIVAAIALAISSAGPAGAEQPKMVVLLCNGISEPPHKHGKPDGKPERITNLQITVNFSWHSVYFEHYEIIRGYNLTIQQDDPNQIGFGGDDVQGGSGYIDGIINRVTGRTDVLFGMFGKDPSSYGEAWHLDCRPAKPLF
jgi:hypothetical protein